MFKYFLIYKLEYQGTLIYILNAWIFTDDEPFIPDPVMTDLFQLDVAKIRVQSISDVQCIIIKIAITHA